MQNIQQIKVVSQALNKEKEKYLFELSRTNNSIEKKIMLIKKMTIYLKDYHADGNLPVTKTLPSLTRNLESFSLQIENVIMQTEEEVEKLRRSSEALLNKVQRIDQKIKVMDLFESRAKQAKLAAADKREQLMIDDISSTKHLRGNYE